MIIADSSLHTIKTALSKWERFNYLKVILNALTMLFLAPHSHIFLAQYY